MHLTSEQIPDYFSRYGWTYSRESDDTWVTGVRTRVSAFRIMVRVTEHWVFFIINPLVVAPENDDDRFRLYYHLLRYNMDMNFAKLGIDGDGDVFMAIELPTESFSYSHFVDALDGLSHHASLIYTEIFGLAHNSDGTTGRYDTELNKADSESQPSSGFNIANQLDDDVFIAGRRLKIVDDENGGTRVELEGSDDDDDDDDDILTYGDDDDDDGIPF